MSAAHTEPLIAPSPNRPQVVPPPVPPNDANAGKPWKWILLLLAALAAGGYAYLRPTGSPAATEASAVPAPQARTVQVTSGTVEQIVRLSGQIGPKEYMNVTAPLLRGDGGREMILMQVVPSGSLVRRGQQIAQIDSQAVADRLDDLGDTVESAQSDIRKREAEQAAEWETLQQSLRVAQAAVVKARLNAKAAELRTDIEKQILQLDLEEAEATYKQQQSDLFQKKISQAANMKMAEIALKTAVRRRDNLARDLKRYTITASMDGMAVMATIIRNNETSMVQQGDRLAPGQPFMKIINPNKMRIEGFVNQAQSSDLRVGLPVRVSLDAFKDLAMNGVVDSIGALASGGPRQGYFIRNVPVKILITGSDPRLIPDLSASADVSIGKPEAGTMVPRSAIVREGNQAVAFVKKADSFERRELTLGAENDTHAIIHSGLKPGEEVRVN